MRFTALALSVATLTGTAAAQNFEFTIDMAQSNYTWDGTTSIGSLVGNPNNTFQLQGTLELDLDGGGSPVGSGEWISADALVVPDISGIIPSSIQGFPPLATIDVSGMRFSIASDPFVVDGAGSFTTNSTLTVTAGILTVTPLVGAATVTDLAGTMGPATPTAGSIIETAGVLHFVSPMVTSFNFTDPTSGISATINLNGTLVGDYTCLAPTIYCPATPNSVGAGSIIGTTGTTSITANNFGLLATGCPANKPGLFFVGMQQAQIPLGDGNLCVSGGIKRFGVLFSDAAGTFTGSVDFNNLPAGLVIEPGQERNVQCWYRDVAAGGAGFNLSNAASIVFCP